MRGSITLAKILGIPIRLHSSWFLVAALVTWSLAGGYFPQEYPGWTAATYWLVGAATAVLFFASVLLHELGHSVLALREKVPVRSITLFIFGGVAQIGREPPTAGAEFRIAVAGPLTSLALAGLAGSLRSAIPADAVLAAPIAYIARINLMLALFNLIPGFPLDGGRLLRALLWGLGGSFRTATRWASWAGRGVAFLFILIGVGQMFLGGFLNGLWTAFIGWFLNNAAESSYQQVVLRDTLAGVKVGNVMTEQCLTVPGSLRLDHLVDDLVLGQGHRCFFVAENGELEGLITLHNIRTVPQDRRNAFTVSQVMTPTDALFKAQPDEDVLTLLQRMDEGDVNQVPVMDDGRLLGVITREHLLRYIRLRSELGV
jgi:Zn-dependent protease/CBS domain-containing protein